MSSPQDSTGCAVCGDQKRPRKDYLSTVDPKWCIGCGCYSVLKNLTGVFSEAGLKTENLVAISGIGCTSRFPYYLNTYGFHTIHGRAPAVALGLKLARPDLAVWIMTGDGDALSIGGNHFMHFIRRNPNIKMLLLNNRIYGLTKGQASPTTASGQKTKSTPFGSIDTPVRPASLALAMGATFVARVPDNDGPLLTEAIAAANSHQGTAVIEVLLNCVIFNDGAHEEITGKEVRKENSLRLQHGKPLIFGNSSEKGIRLRGSEPEVVSFDPAAPPADLLVHDIHAANPSSAYAISLIEHPCALGILRQVEAPVYEEQYAAPEKLDDLQKFLSGNSSWIEGGNSSKAGRSA